MFAKLKVWQKLTLIAVVMSIPLGVVVGLFILNEEQLILKTKREQKGLFYLRPVEEVLRLGTAHRGQADAFLRGSFTAEEELTATGARMGQAIGTLEAAERRFGSLLGTSRQWQELRQSWEQLQSSFRDLSPEESFEAHSAWIDQGLGLFDTVTEKSTLVLDPELDPSRMVTAIEFLPRLDENLARLAQIGASAGILDEGTGEDAFAPQDTIQRQRAADLALLRATATSRMDEISESLGAVLLSDARLKRTLEAPLTEARTAVQAFLAQATHDAEALETTQASLQTLFDRTVSELDESLALRVVRSRNQEIFQLLVSFAFLAIAIGLVVAISRALTDQVGVMLAAFRRIGMGDFTARAPALSTDELGDLAGNLNGLFDNVLGLMQTQEEREQMQQSITKLLQEVADVAEGDLTVEAEVSTEITGAIADSFNFMIAELRRVISEVQNTTLNVSSAASDIQAATERLAEGSEDQSRQILDTSSAIETMARSIQRVSENAQSAAGVAEDALKNAQRGNDAVTKTVEGMGAIRQQVQETAKRIKRLGESSQEVGEIVQLIGDIADRTSILALNASIQAAMAGEAGRGFAVVAEEVERLAERSAQAAARIEGLIKTIQSETNEAVAAMEDTTREVVSGSGLAHEAGRSLDEIQQVSSQLAELIGSISTSSSQQAQGSENVARSMGTISQITQQTADGTKETAASIRDLAALADRLRQGVSTFKLPGKAA